MSLKIAIPTGDVIAAGEFSSTLVLKNLSDGERMVGEVLECTLDIEMLETISEFVHFNIVECKGVCFIPDKIMPVLLTEKCQVLSNHISYSEGQS